MDILFAWAIWGVGVAILTPVALVCMFDRDREQRDRYDYAVICIWLAWVLPVFLRAYLMVVAD